MKRGLWIVIAATVAAAFVLVAFPAVREEIGWRWTLYRDRAESYSGYIATWPNGKHSNEAHVLLDENVWESNINTKRQVKITETDTEFRVGSLPLFLATYTKEGGSVPGVSGKWRDIVVDLTALDSKFVPVGYQHDTGGKFLALLCKAVHPKHAVTEDGLVFLLPKASGKLKADGPFVRVTLLSGDGKQVDPHILTVAAWTAPETPHKVYITDENLIVIEKIGNTPQLQKP
jgi:hypothetical protein